MNKLAISIISIFSILGILVTILILLVVLRKKNKTTSLKYATLRHSTRPSASVHTSTPPVSTHTSTLPRQLPTLPPVSTHTSTPSQQFSTLPPVSTHTSPPHLSDTSMDSPSILKDNAFFLSPPSKEYQIKNKTSYCDPVTKQCKIGVNPLTHSSIVYLNKNICESSSLECGGDVLHAKEKPPKAPVLKVPMCCQNGDQSIVEGFDSVDNSNLCLTKKEAQNPDKNPLRNYKVNCDSLPTNPNKTRYPPDMGKVCEYHCNPWYKTVDKNYKETCKSGVPPDNFTNEVVTLFTDEKSCNDHQMAGIWKCTPEGCIRPVDSNGNFTFEGDFKNEAICKDNCLITCPSCIPNTEWLNDFDNSSHFYTGPLADPKYADKTDDEIHKICTKSCAADTTGDMYYCDTANYSCSKGSSLVAGTVTYSNESDCKSQCTASTDTFKKPPEPTTRVNVRLNLNYIDHEPYIRLQVGEGEWRNVLFDSGSGDLWVSSDAFTDKDTTIASRVVFKEGAVNPLINQYCGSCSQLPSCYPGGTTATCACSYMGCDCSDGKILKDGTVVKAASGMCCSTYIQPFKNKITFQGADSFSVCGIISKSSGCASSVFGGICGVWDPLAPSNDKNIEEPDQTVSLYHMYLAMSNSPGVYPSSHMNYSYSTKISAPDGQITLDLLIQDTDTENDDITWLYKDPSQTYWTTRLQKIVGKNGTVIFNAVSSENIGDANNSACIFDTGTEQYGSCIAQTLIIEHIQKYSPDYISYFFYELDETQSNRYGTKTAEYRIYKWQFLKYISQLDCSKHSLDMSSNNKCAIPNWYVKGTPDEFPQSEGKVFWDGGFFESQSPGFNNYYNPPTYIYSPTYTEENLFGNLFFANKKIIFDSLNQRIGFKELTSTAADKEYLKYTSNKFDTYNKMFTTKESYMKTPTKMHPFFQQPTPWRKKPPLLPKHHYTSKNEHVLQAALMLITLQKEQTLPVIEKC